MSTTLIPAPLIAGAAEPLPAIARAAADVPLDTPTPCAEWDLGALVRHILYWSPLLAAAARRTAPVPVAESEQDVDLTGWPDAVEAATTDLVDAWSDAGAWHGTVSLGGPDPLPAPMIGGMTFGEIVLHGWDVARAVGVEPQWDDDVLAAAHGAVAAMAEQGRGMGVFGPEVVVPAGSPALHRLVGLAGRNPLWTPGA